MAVISPVMMKVSGLPLMQVSDLPLMLDFVTVGSRGLGKQFSNSLASCGSLSLFFVSAITCSMTGLMKQRSLGGGRLPFASNIMVSSFARYCLTQRGRPSKFNHESWPGLIKRGHDLCRFPSP